MKNLVVIETEFKTKGAYVKADRGNTLYPICINVNGKLYWLKPSEIKSIVIDGINYTVEKFCKILQISF